MITTIIPNIAKLKPYTKLNSDAGYTEVITNCIGNPKLAMTNIIKNFSIHQFSIPILIFGVYTKHKS